MRCSLCGCEITRDMTDTEGRILVVPTRTKDIYICCDCEDDIREDWDTLHDMEVNE